MIERAQHKREYDSWESIGDIIQRAGYEQADQNDETPPNADDADIRPKYDEEPMVGVTNQLLKSISFDTGQQHYWHLTS
ncbi:hypothetical protein Tco_0850648 [Tanacetum coccineum]